LRLRRHVGTQGVVNAPGLRYLASAIVMVALGVGCSARQERPPRPALPEVAYVRPCDPDAVIALTATDEKALVVRDRLLLEYIQELEALLGENP
jgi:hypothetical protein